VKKIQRLKKLHRLLKLQEQDVLAEFKDLQNMSHQINKQISDLINHSAQSRNNLMHNAIDVSKLTLVRKFNQKIEMVIEQLHNRLADNEKNFLIVADKVKQLRSSLTSIKRLTDKHQLIENYEQDKNTQKQIEENINYTVSSQES
jgi:erythromycin esterase-like protein